MAKSWDPFGDSWSLRNFDWNVGKSHIPGGGEWEGYGREGRDDIVDRLPADPFGMDSKSRFTAVKGWIEALEADFGSGFGKSGVDDGERKFCGDGLFTGFDWFLNDGTRLQPQSGNVSSMSVYDSMDDLGIDCEYCDLGSKAFFGNVFLSSEGKELTISEERDTEACSVSTDDCSPRSLGVDSVFSASSGAVFDEGKECGDNEGGEANEGMTYALAYLGVKDLLTVEKVSKSLRHNVRNNAELWKSIYIDQPLSEKITDDALGKLAGKAHGDLRSLTLVGCTKISDAGLMQVFQSNPGLLKLSVPRCLRLTVDGIIGIFKALKSAGTLKLKYLRFGCFVGVTDQQFEQLCSILSAQRQTELMSNKRKPQFYHIRQFYISCDDDSAFDIERCPKCQKPKLVYDCPFESCQGSNNQAASQLCRACTQCIPRCIQCGQCIRDRDYEETFTLDHLCLVCRTQLQMCDEEHEMKSVSSSGSFVFVDK